MASPVEIVENKSRSGEHEDIGASPGGLKQLETDWKRKSKKEMVRHAKSCKILNASEEILET